MHPRKSWRAVVPEAHWPKHNRSALLAVALVMGITTLATAQPISFQASNGQWMVAEGGGGGTVNANRNSPGSWETFSIEDFNGGDLYDGDQVAFRTDNGSYLQAQNGGGGEFLAIGGGAGPHETFTIVLLSGADGRVDDGEFVALRSVNGYYVVAEGGGGGIVNCNRTDIGSWEQWRVSRGGGGPPPPQNKFVLLINGSFAESPAGWTAPGSPMFNAVAATYGVTPDPWPWTTNSFGDVIAPNYNGIWYGGWQLANYLASLPAGEVNIISHSHGGNVVLASQVWSGRQIRRYIQLATPVNWDFGQWRYAIGYTVAGRCQVSSDTDWVQFFGASPGQITNFAIAMYAAHAGSQEAYDALRRGDYWEAFAWFAAASFAAYAADYWFWTTKDEVEGADWVFYNYGLGHSDMHEPPVWNAIAPYCK